MPSTIFYSWQSDLPNATNRRLVRDTLENVARVICDDSSIDVEPRVDHDTDGEPGAPDIAETIFAKIEQCTVFVGDVSIVGTIPSRDPNRKPTPTPNPNVLFELAYAVRALGWPRVVMVMNTAYGSPEQLPFDLRGRRVLTYLGRADGERAPMRRELEAKLRHACDAIFRSLIDAEDGPALAPQERRLEVWFDPTECREEQRAEVPPGRVSVQRVYSVRVHNPSSVSVDNVALRLEWCVPPRERIALPAPMRANVQLARGEKAAHAHTLDPEATLTFYLASKWTPTIRSANNDELLTLHTLPAKQRLPVGRYVVAVIATGRDVPLTRVHLVLSDDADGLLECRVATPEEVAEAKAAPPEERLVIKQQPASTARPVRYRIGSSWMRR